MVLIKSHSQTKTQNENVELPDFSSETRALSRTCQQPQLAPESSCWCGVAQQSLSQPSQSSHTPFIPPGWNLAARRGPCSAYLPLGGRAAWEEWRPPADVGCWGLAVQPRPGATTFTVIPLLLPPACCPLTACWQLWPEDR